MDLYLVYKFFSFGAVTFVIRKATLMVLQEGSNQLASNGDSISLGTTIFGSSVKTIQMIYG